MCDRKSTPTPFSELPAESRAGFYALLANAWRYPDESFAGCFLRPSGVDALLKGLDELPACLADKVKDLRELVSRLSRTPLADLLSRLQAEFVRLFGHSVRGSCPPYELEFGRGEIIQQTAELADLAGFYSAFGLNLTEAAYERADHVAVECEFLSVLCAKEAWGRQNDNHDLSETCADAQRLFLRDHLAKWLPAYAHRVEAADSEGFYGRAASLASAFIREECRRFEIEVGPQWLELCPADPERDSMIDCDTAGCGDAGENRLIQLGIDARSGSAR
jgi:DMSO reductase family type II enzyme chaperone